MWLWLVGAVLVFGGLLYSYIASHPEGVLDNKHEGEVRAVVGAFGNELNAVSLLAPDAVEQMRRVYAPYVAPALLASWSTDLSRAPGRDTSSPWPSHIEIDSVTETEEGEYAVRGRIMLVTSTGDAGSVPVALTVRNTTEGYHITDYKENPDAPVETPHTVSTTVALNEAASAFGVTVTPTEVVEDSRCPMDAMCIQQGTLRVAITTLDGMGTSTSVIELSAEEPVTTETASIWLTEGMPYPMASNPTELEQYRFTFRIEPR